MITPALQRCRPAPDDGAGVPSSYSLARFGMSARASATSRISVVLSTTPAGRSQAR
ncbi:MAG TPA: hypothetical protein VF940_11860 [Streptosporangiaceae bacterium]